MYRCEICGAVSKPGTPRITHLIKRPNGQIERELTICAKCRTDLAIGCTLQDLLYINQTLKRPVPFARRK